uniref:Peptidase A2 domain-containing protein n=1 Tax=Sander lucioperca TaxID=283035 RepID=A0A8D0A1P9_SANLU
MLTCSILSHLSLTALQEIMGGLQRLSTLPAVACGLVFDLQPHSYATEKAKIAYLIELLRGAALEWASVHWRRQDQPTATYAAFTAEMTKVFDHPVQGKDDQTLELQALIDSGADESFLDTMLVK